MRTLFILLALASLSATLACKRHSPLPEECEAELAYMACVAEQLTPGPTRPDVGAIRNEYERDLAAKGGAALAARCRVDLASLKLTSGSMCADAG
jgi:hypothetical protein